LTVFALDGSITKSKGLKLSNVDEFLNFYN
jgi:hypothetical protein